MNGTIQSNYDPHSTGMFEASQVKLSGDTTIACIFQVPESP